MEPDELRAVISANIRAFAAKRGISLNLLVDLAALTRSSFFRTLGGQGAWKSDALARIAEVLEVDAAVLLVPPQRRH